MREEPDEPPRGGVRRDVAGLVASSESCGEYSEKLRGKAAPAKTGE